jgi:hypothetical protein
MTRVAMKMDELRQEMEACRKEADDDARRLKDSYSALEKLHLQYRGLHAREREMADQVIAEWALSEDEGKRFDALALIDTFKIGSAVVALQKLATRLAVSEAPSAPYELEKVVRMVSKLLGGPGTERS